MIIKVTLKNVHYCTGCPCLIGDAIDCGLYPKEQLQIALVKDAKGQNDCLYLRPDKCKKDNGL